MDFDEKLRKIKSKVTLNKHAKHVEETSLDEIKRLTHILILYTELINDLSTKISLYH